jgi:hypothetical protein
MNGKRVGSPEGTKTVREPEGWGLVAVGVVVEGDVVVVAGGVVVEGAPPLMARYAPATATIRTTTTIATRADVEIPLVRDIKFHLMVSSLREVL